MGGIQEAKYIQVIWQDRETARKIVESHDSLRLEPIDENTTEVEIVSYSRIDDGSPGQFAVRIDSQSFDVPRVEQVNGTSMDLLPVTDPVTGLRWWVEGRTWDNKRGRWLSDIYRGVGEVRIKVGVQSCRVKISTSTFTYQELERYLTDFQTDFWELILDDASYISGAARRNQHNLLDEATLRAIAKFIEYVELALQNPKVELREVQRLKPRKDVRPVPRTFMEMATRGSTRTLTSRAYQESLDLPENRYAHHALRKVYQITKALCSVAASQARSLERNLEAHRQRLSNFSDIKVINKEAVMYDLMDKERAIVEMASRVSEKNAHLSQLARSHPATGLQDFQGKRLQRLLVIFGKRADLIQGKPFFAKIRSNESKPWYVFPDGGFATVNLGVFSEELEPNSDYEYEILGEIHYTTIAGTNKTRHNFALLTVNEFRIRKSQKHESLTQRLNAAQQQVRDLEKCGWQLPPASE